MRRATYLFITAEVILYGVFLSIDFANSSYLRLGTYLKLFSILLCACYTQSIAIQKRFYSQWICKSFLFLIISDYFLLISNLYMYGVSTFLIVQMCYYGFLDEVGQSKKKIYQRLLQYLLQNVCITGGVFCGLLWFQISIDATLAIATLYFITFIRNIIVAIRICDKQGGHRILLFTIGLVLYFICDINVAIFNMGGYIELSSTLFLRVYQFSEIAMWMFYLPGIVLITLSNDISIQRFRDCV